MMVVIVCLSFSQSHDLLVFDISNPRGQLENDVFINLNDLFQTHSAYRFCKLV